MLESEPSVCAGRKESPDESAQGVRRAVPLSWMTGGGGVVASFVGGHEFARRAKDMGLQAGGRIEVIQPCGAAGGPALITVGEARLSLGFGMAEKILVAPDSPDSVAARETLTLADLLTGDCARIARVRGGGPAGIRRRLLDMGVTRGSLVRLERHAPLGDPLVITVKGYYLALRMSEARRIEVERV